MTRRAAPWGVTALSAVLVATTGLSAPAQAGNGREAPSAEPSPAPQYQDIPRCRAYGSSAGFGVACTGPGGKGGSLRALLNGPLPECWHSDPPEGFRAPATTQDQGEGRWWLRTCMTGVDRSTLKPAGTGISLTYGYEFLPPGAERQLNPGEEKVIDALVARGQVPIPFPLAETSPTASPRVGQVASFALANETRTRSITVDGVTMYAEVTGLRVEPEGLGGPVVTCDGPGRALTAAEVDAGRADGADVCAYTYERSSFRAGEGDRDRDSRDRYPVRVTALWTVHWSTDDARGNGTFGPFPKSAFNEVRVAEVQTLVVS